MVFEARSWAYLSRDGFYTSVAMKKNPGIDL